MSKELKEYFNRLPRLATLSTAAKDGRVDAAYFGSPFMPDEKTVEMSLANNRTFANLKENPYAAFTIMEPGKTLQEWKGVRVYLKMVECRTEGEEFEAAKARVREKAGDDAAKGLHASITFEVYDIRPLVDMGQTWGA